MRINETVADWIFSERYVSQGTSIEFGNMVIQDASGNGNELMMAVAGSPITESLSFIENGGLAFVNARKTGYYLTTVADAPINLEEFAAGFTIEAEFKLGPDINDWMGILTRLGNNSVEQEPLSLLAISNVGEIQWASTPSNRPELWTNWSNALGAIRTWAKSEDYTHVAVVNDGRQTRMFVNGVESIRNPLADSICGIAGEANRGWNVGANEWDFEPISLFLGEIKRIRVMNRALAPSEFFKTEFDYRVDYGTNDDLELFAPGTYTFAIIPDPQYVVQSKPEILEKQLEFIANHYEPYNIAMSVNVGDSTQSSAPVEWESANRAFQILDRANAPYVVTRGNHDLNGTGYLDTFGAPRFAGKSYFKGASPSGLSSYSIIRAGSYQYMFLAVDSVGDKASNANERYWAQTVLDTNQQIPTVIVSHDILTISDDGVISEGGQGAKVWNELVKDYSQVFMMIGGHISGAGLNVKRNTAGKDVLQVLSNYQSDIAGGNGWTSFFEFDERNNEIRLKTFSPYVASLADEQRSYLDVKFLTGPGDQYEIAFHFAERFDFTAS